MALGTCHPTCAHARIYAIHTYHDTVRLQLLALYQRTPTQTIDTGCVRRQRAGKPCVVYDRLQIAASSSQEACAAPVHFQWKLRDKERAIGQREESEAREPPMS